MNPVITSSAIDCIVTLITVQSVVDSSKYCIASKYVVISYTAVNHIC